MSLFKDKVAIVTGGGSGIGRALCEELGRVGAVVIVADINTEGALQVASSINSNGGRARMAHLDITQAGDVEKLVQETASEHGRLDYMFNNAGISIMGEMRNFNLDHWKRMIDVNLWGVIHGTAAAYRLMIGQGFGHIVNTASAAGLAPSDVNTLHRYQACGSRAVNFVARRVSRLRCQCKCSLSRFYKNSYYGISGISKN